MHDSIHNIMNEWLDRYGADPNKGGDDRDGQPGRKQKKSARKMDSERKIDLHGLTSAEAISALDHFINKCRQEGVKKILIVHGKGIHSSDGPVLRNEIHNFLQTNPKIGQMGTPGRAEGGSGAVWAVIR